MTPSLAIVRIHSAGNPGVPIVLPLFLLWIPALILAPIALLVLAAVCLGTRVPFFGAVRALWELTCGLTGTDVRVVADGRRIEVRIL